jgi:hypothetical protein
MADHAPEGRVAAGPARRAIADDAAPAGGPFATVRKQAAGGSGAALGVWAAVVCAVALGVAGLVGILLHQPWIFPSLGPTLMVLLETPGQPAARPRNVLVGHAVAVAAGYLALVVAGLRTAPAVVQAGLDGRYVMSAVIALAGTVVVLQVLHMPHPPAGATTLIVALGILKTPGDLVVIVLAVVLVTIVATAANVAAMVRQTGVTDARRPSRG